MKIQAKLKDQTGASITYALLLFLVCAVVGSVVLAAGTAAAGRMSKAVDTDRRYYAVTSAARVLKDKLDGSSNSIVYDYSGTITNGEIDEEKLSAKSFDNASITADKTYGITDFASAFLGGIVGNSNAVLGFSVNDESLISVKETVIAATTNSEPKLYLEVSNAGEDEGAYTLRLTFTAGIEDVISKKKVAGEEDTIEITRKITWDYYDVETGAVVDAG